MSGPTGGRRRLAPDQRGDRRNRLVLPGNKRRFGGLDRSDELSLLTLRKVVRKG